VGVRPNPAHRQGRARDYQKHRSGRPLSF
jgi:hypothetical protein